MESHPELFNFLRGLLAIKQLETFYRFFKLLLFLLGKQRRVGLGLKFLLEFFIEFFYLVTAFAVGLFNYF